MKRTALFVMATLLVCLLASPVAGAADDILEHPLIRPFPGSILAKNLSKYVAFEAFDFPVRDPGSGKREKINVKGEYRRLLYEVYREDGQRNKDISRLEFFENFKAAALEQGGEVRSEDPQGLLVFTLPREDGGITWCQVETTTLGQTYLTIVDEKPFTRSLTFGPAEMKTALDEDGRIILYDILFDYDKAILQQSSDKQLQHIVTLMMKNPELRIEVQGHTDSQGSDDYNLDLSQRRAETVVEYLSLFGVAEDRLTARGYGESEPVDTNDTEAGRVKNRRVELVRIDD
ncbi:MAG TPA: OmpA family protein [Synergistales bacterium]|jgi:outer membrane protein OmpA-like peptidoglycan-associated protein|nr:OmpA family protein [Synergistales bacterium]MDY0179397.1 OmpA family protein [Synergistaceae bacterium]HRW87782.1 OmpA family protein [Thermovirgaceae bacterium]MDD3830757.1 OmpA family protein [Synergistales bacterium]MDD4023673.1 OmpA family protein [Synergistales bacterium]